MEPRHGKPHSSLAGIMTDKSVAAISPSNRTSDPSKSIAADLPTEILINIFSYTSLIDQIQASQVCLRWRDILVSDQSLKRCRYLTSVVGDSVFGLHRFFGFYDSSCEVGLELFSCLLQHGFVTKYELSPFITPQISPTPNGPEDAIFSVSGNSFDLTKCGFIEDPLFISYPVASGGVPRGTLVGSPRRWDFDNDSKTNVFLDITILTPRISNSRNWHFVSGVKNLPMHKLIPKAEVINLNLRGFTDLAAILIFGEMDRLSIDRRRPCRVDFALRRVKKGWSVDTFVYHPDRRA
ncbi:hypothetical protein TWF694_007272 [Orbilia ellipsospora]|uniref:F-box domain-containing protein n=1 Tax=Orbilia ellipsospora TaxID=2528407 RepID=A0AAV9XKM9_9PEZI